MHACHFISASSSSLLLLFAENQIMQRQTTIEKQHTHLKLVFYSQKLDEIVKQNSMIKISVHVSEIWI